MVLCLVKGAALFAAGAPGHKPPASARGKLLPVPALALGACGRIPALALKRPIPVGSYQPNRFGLYDIHGNVWQWCHDWYAADYYTTSPKEDPAGPANGDRRVLRGGSWINYGRDCRAASRYHNAPGYRLHMVGFRVACALGVRTP